MDRYKAPGHYPLDIRRKSFYTNRSRSLSAIRYFPNGLNEAEHHQPTRTSSNTITSGMSSVSYLRLSKRI